MQVEEARIVCTHCGLGDPYCLIYHEWWCQVCYEQLEREQVEDEDDDVPDITAMIRSLGRSYRSR